MTAREFLSNYRPSLHAIVKSMEYNTPEIAKKIMLKDPELVLTEDYRDTLNVYIEETKTCDSPEEAVSWMVHTGKLAIQYGLDTKNLDWKVKFMVAWDISHNLTSNENEWVA